MNFLKEYILCPYNPNHIIKRYNAQHHIPNCKRKYQDVFYLTCRFNCQRLCQEDIQFWCLSTPGRLSSKSSRRRLRIKERQTRKAQMQRNNEPSRNSNVDEKAVKMDKEQEMTDPWKEHVREESSKKNLENDPSHKLSKSAKKRHQKKLNKEKATGKDVPEDKSDEKKEYVIKLKPTTPVTESNRSHKEVYIHYPTKKLLSAESVPKSGFGIEPMMLQRVCLEAFKQMQYPSDGEGGEFSLQVNEDWDKTIQGSKETASGVALSVNEYENKTIQGSKETASGVALSVNEYENKTIQGSNDTANGVALSVNEDENQIIQCSDETASGVAPSVIKKEKKTTPTYAGKRNAALSNSKRSRSKKNKKKWNVNPKTTAPSNAAKPAGTKPTFQELERRDRFAKYMVPDPDVWPPPPPPRPDPYTFPPPYLGYEEDYFRRESEHLVYSAEHDHEDHDAYEHLYNDEQATENELSDEQATENEFSDEYENASSIN